MTALDAEDVAEAVAALLGCRLDCVTRCDAAALVESYADQAAHQAVSHARDEWQAYVEQRVEDAVEEEVAKILAAAKARRSRNAAPAADALDDQTVCERLPPEAEPADAAKKAVAAYAGEATRQRRQVAAGAVLVLPGEA